MMNTPPTLMAMGPESTCESGGCHAQEGVGKAPAGVRLCGACHVSFLSSPHKSAARHVQRNMWHLQHVHVHVQRAHMACTCTNVRMWPMACGLWPVASDMWHMHLNVALHCGRTAHREETKTRELTECIHSEGLDDQRAGLLSWAGLVAR